MADTAEQQIVLELVAQFDQAVASLDSLRDRINNAFSDSADAAKTHLGTITDAADDATEQLGKAGEEGGSAFGKGLTLAFAAAATTFLETLHSTLQQAQDYSNEVDLLSKISGDSSQRVQQLEYAMRGVGMSFEQVHYQISNFERRLSAAAALAKDTSSPFYQLGLNAKEMIGKDANTNIEAVAEAVSNLKDKAQQTQIAMELFGGRMGARMLVLLDQGKSGIEAMEEAAKGMGAIIPDSVLEKLQKWADISSQLEQTWRAFFVSIGEPLIDLFSRGADSMSHFLASVENLSSLQRLQILIGSIVTSFFALEMGLETVGRFLAGSVIRRELIDAAKDLAGKLQFLAAAVGLVILAFRTNFADVQTVTLEVFGALKTAVENTHNAFTGFAATIGPEFHKLLTTLSADFTPLVRQLGDMAIAVIRNHDLWNALADIIGGILLVLEKVVEAIGFVVKKLSEMNEWLAIAVSTSVGVPALTAAVGLLTGAFQRLFTALKLDLFISYVGIVGRATTAAYDLAGATGVLTVAMNLLRAALMRLGIPALVFAIIDAITHWAAFRIGVEQVVKVLIDFQVNVIAGLLAAFAKLLSVMADIDHAIGRWIPGFTQMGDTLDRIAQKADNAADHLRSMREEFDNAVTESQREIAQPDSDTREADFRRGGIYAHIKHVAKKTKTPSSVLEPVTRGKTGDQTSQTIQNIISNMEMIDAQIAITEANIGRLHTQFQKLGELDTADKRQKAERFISEEIRQQNDLYAEQIARRKKLEADIAALGAHAASSKGKDRREYLKEEYRLRAEVGKIGSAEDIAADAYNKKLQARIELSKALLAVTEDQRAHHQKMADLASSAYEQSVQHTERMRNLTPLGADPTGGKARARAIADAQDQVDIFSRKLADANNAQDQANRALRDAEYAYEHHIITLKELNGYVQKAAEADNNYIKATNDLTEAQKKLKVEQQATVDPVVKTRDALLSLAQQAAPEVVKVFEDIRAGMNPLVAIFVALFEKTRAFHDIMLVFQAVVATVANILDALRAPLDLLLGVVIGLVDGFVAMINLVIMILNLFGLHIKYLQHVNDFLNQFATNVKPLLDITHDLPTINEYNKGQWADLVAKADSANSLANDQNNILTNGFNQSLAKLGTIIGELIAIKMVLSAVGLFGGGGGGGSTGGGVIGSIVNFVKGLFSHGKQVDTNTTALQAAANAANENSEAFKEMTGQVKTLDSSISKSSTTTSGGLTGAVNTLQKGVAGLGDVMGIVAGFQQGGIMGGVEAGFATSSLASLLLTGGAAAGPAGLIAGVVVGGLAALFGGNHDNPAAMPDKYDTARFTQFVGELQGSAGTAYGPAYNPSTDQIQQALGGQSMLSYIENWLNANLSSTNPQIVALAQQLKAQFGSGQLQFGKDIGQESLSGGTLSGTYVSIHDAAEQAIESIQKLGTAAMNLSDVLGGAQSVNLATLFGNGSVVTAEGGFAVTPGGGTSGGGGVSSEPGTTQTPQINVQIGTVNGTDPATVEQVMTDALSQAWTKLARDQQAARRTRQFVYGGGGG